MANPKKGSDDGVVTSAPSAGVNSLLNDLLSEAQAGVDEERKKVDNAAQLKERQAKELRDREEGKKREEAQQKLIEENRRRNEALARRERAEGEKKVLATAPHMRPVDEGPVAAAAEVATLKPTSKPISKLLLAALVLVGLGLGLGGAFAMQPEARGAFPDVDDAARAVVLQTARAAAAEQRVGAQLAAAQKQIDSLNGNLGGAGLEAKKLRTELDKLKADLKKTNDELAVAKEAASSTRPIRRGGSGGSGLPSLGGSVFK